MIRTCEDYRASIRDGRKVCANRVTVPDAGGHPLVRSLRHIRARASGMKHHAATAPAMSARDGGNAPSHGREPLGARPHATDRAAKGSGGSVIRVGEDLECQIRPLWDGTVAKWYSDRAPKVKE